MNRQSLLREVRTLEEKLEHTMRHVGILERIIAETQTRYDRAYHSNQQLFMMNQQLKLSSLKDITQMDLIHMQYAMALAHSIFEISKFQLKKIK